MAMAWRRMAVWAACAATPLAVVAPSWAEGPLKVVFPPSGYQTTAERIFMVGTGPVGGSVTINGRAVDRSPAGHFAPSFPLQPGENVFNVAGGGQSLTIRVTRQPAAPAAPSGLAFGAGSLTPAVDVARLPGEVVRFGAIAPPGATVTVWWANRRVTLAPQPPRTELPDNKGLLIAQNQPRMLNGVYYEGAVAPTAPIAISRPVYQVTLNGRTLKQDAPGRVAVLDPANPPVVQVTAEEGVARSGPGSDYSRLTPLPRFTRAGVVGREGDWLHLDYGGWLRSAETEALPGAQPPRTIVRSLSTRRVDGWTELRVPLEAPVPVQISQADHRFVVTLFGATAQTDIIHVDDDPLVSRLDFEQEAPGRVRYALALKPTHAGGYQVRYEGSTLVVALRHPPDQAAGRPLAGKRIVLDPGHGGREDPGTTGPTGLSEKDLTLPMACLVRDELVRRGATVTLTRERDGYVDLKDRTALIRRDKPDLALSLHYNALPDAGDARHTRGIGAFWFDPLSHSLARTLHQELTTRLKRPSYGLYWDNLAMTRPTVCPAVLLELGFLTNPEEFEWVVDPAAQRQVAGAIADGLERWFSQPD